MTRLFAIASVLLLFLQASTADSTTPTPDASATLIGSAWISFYWSVDENDYPAGESPLIVDGNVYSVSAAFKKELAMEGSGWLKTTAGKSIVFDHRDCEGEIRYRFTSASFGDGIGTCALSPYRTIAVDPRFVKFGTTVFIPEMKGIELPDGTTHDGIFMAIDRGSAIKGDHIDVFTMRGRRSTAAFEKHGIKHRSRVTLFKVADPAPGGCHEAENVKTASRLAALKVLREQFKDDAAVKVIDGRMSELLDEWRFNGEAASDPQLVEKYLPLERCWVERTRGGRTSGPP